MMSVSVDASGVEFLSKVVKDLRYHSTGIVDLTLRVHPHSLPERQRISRINTEKLGWEKNSVCQRFLGTN